jgi:hypothetical protein
MVICRVIETWLPCFKIHGVAMFWAIEASTMAHTENNNGKKTNET